MEKICEQTKEQMVGVDGSLGAAGELRLGKGSYYAKQVSGQSDVLIYLARFWSTLLRYELQVVEI